MSSRHAATVGCHGGKTEKVVECRCLQSGFEVEKETTGFDRLRFWR
jgi:hypothetical protein